VAPLDPFASLWDLLIAVPAPRAAARVDRRASSARGGTIVHEALALRIIAGILLLLSAVLHLLLGGGFLLSSRYQQFKAQMDAGDISSVSKDLDVPDEELNKIHQAAKAKTAGAGMRQLVLGGGLGALALLQLVAGVWNFLRRKRKLTLVVAGASLTLLVVTMALEGFITLGAIACGALVLAALLGALAKAPPSAHVTTT
jgi:hypothetical protein